MFFSFFLMVLLHGNLLMASWKPKRIGNINYAFLDKQQDKHGVN